MIAFNTRWESRRSHIFHRCEHRLNASTDSAEALDFTHTYPTAESVRVRVHIRVHVTRVSVDTGERGDEWWKADGSSTLPSTVSSRIALLPANVCHVWHTRRALRGEHGRLRVPRCVWESERTRAIAHARFSPCTASTHGVTYYTIATSASTARRHTPHVALPRRTHERY